jgi:hypothetical protein
MPAVVGISADVSAAAQRGNTLPISPCRTIRRSLSWPWLRFKVPANKMESAMRMTGAACLVAICGATCLLALLPVLDARRAVEMPTRKAGLWEMKVVRTGFPMPVPEMTMQHCTDASTDKEMSSTSESTFDMCSKQDIQKTATGYVTDSVCGGGMSITSDITGDFNSAYTVKSTSHNQVYYTSLGKGTSVHSANLPRDLTTTIEAKWLGACKPDQKAGDIVMPSGVKMNVKDMEKLKALMPKSNMPKSN